MKVMLEPGAKMPTRAHYEDAGMDIYAMKGGIVPAHGSAVFHTGVHVQLPPFSMGDMRSKSGLMFNHEITSDGTVDVGYTGEIMVKLFNHGNEDYTVNDGDKISQLVIVPILRENPEVVDWPDGFKSCWSTRGNKGFGSSGR